MKNYEVIEFVERFDEIKQLKGTLEFTKAIVRNYRLAQEQVEALELIHQESDEYKEFIKRKEQLLVEHSKKNEDGSPIIKDLPVGNKRFKQYELENPAEYQNSFIELSTEFDAALKEQNEREMNYMKALEEVSEIEFKMFKDRDLPQLTVEQMLLIENFIEYND